VLSAEAARVEDAYTLRLDHISRGLPGRGRASHVELHPSLQPKVFAMSLLDAQMAGNQFWLKASWLKASLTDKAPFRYT
jgi:hypothetical protein